MQGAGEVMPIKTYLKNLNSKYITGGATEHTHRPALQNLLEQLLPDVTIINEPTRLDCGAPDYLVMDNQVPVAFIEAKDVGDSDLLGKNKNRAQFERYKKALDTILFTDYLTFLLCKEGEIIERVSIGEAADTILPLPENFEKFLHLIDIFSNAKPQKITSSKKLAHVMANKARLMAVAIESALLQNNAGNSLAGEMAAFKEILIHDITPKAFADFYAQTIAYGMFAARIHDNSTDTFSRTKAAELIPKTNPFLRKLFQNIAAFDLDKRIDWIVDDLAAAFNATDMRAVMKSFGKDQRDPIIHFYEDFLSSYDSRLRMARGVFYTPQPVVRFIVQAIDEILRNDFNLQAGLADSSKVKISVKNRDITETHKVQILDPAAGMGTFLVETAKKIQEYFSDQAGAWQSYVEQHLIPRLNGFELMMAPYTMAHVNFDWMLTESGYAATESQQRLRIYLTNSLEEHHPETGTLFAQFLANEAKEADYIKRDTPVMVVLGNPPYSGESKNKGEWIYSLIEDYKKEPGTNKPLKERQKKWLNNDYCKFIRLGQHYVDKNKEGILAFITSHSFIDGLIFRGMRWNLMKSFDKIYILDLHGNVKKNETLSSGIKDEGIFDIEEGTSINIFIKTGTKKSNALAEVYHYDLFGKRQMKYDYLQKTSLSTIPFVRLRPAAPEYFFVQKDIKRSNKYKKGFSITALLPVSAVGIVTAKDTFTIRNSPEEVSLLINKFLSIQNDDEVRKEFNLGKDTNSWSVANARKDLESSERNIIPIAYRPFDTRYTCYTGVSNGFHGRPIKRVMRHFILRDNYGLALCKQFKSGNSYHHAFISTDSIESGYVSNKTSEITSVFPLYVYPESDDSRQPNLNKEIVDAIAQKIRLEFEPEQSGNSGAFSPIDILDYMYAVLYCPDYREQYKEFLKTDFPSIPYPADEKSFRSLAEAGAELRALHLLTHPSLNTPITRYPITGSNQIDQRPVWESRGNDIGRVWINAQQYFDNVPLSVWDFRIGGYQPAKKWLGDRKGGTLTFDQIMHYQKFLTAMNATVGVMERIKIPYL